MLDSYLEEIDRLKNRLKASKSSDSQGQISEMYDEIDNLNKIIDFLKSENIRLKSALGLQEGQKAQRVRIDEIDGLAEKLKGLEVKLTSSSLQAE